MDYKYIEQLLERYWDCETTLEEEQILKTFFRQDDVPSNLIQYKSLFVYQEEEKNRSLNEEFDKKILSLIEKPVVKAQRLTIYKRFAPLFKAAAMIVVVSTIGMVMKSSLDKDGNLIYVYDQYQGSNNDPQVAYDSKLPIDSINKLVKDRDKNLIDK